MAVGVGLDIGSSAVRAVQVSYKGKGAATLDRVGQVMLPPDAVRDGEIADIEAVTESLKELWSRYRFRSRKVRLGVANQQVVVRQVDLPYVPDAERRAALEFQAQELLPIPVEQAYLDSYVVDHYETEEGQKLTRMLLIGAQRTMIDNAVAAVEDAKLQPVGLDLDAFALLRSLTAQDTFAGECQLVVDVGESVTDLVVAEAGQPRFVRILMMGGGTITGALVNALGMTRDDAEALKRARVPATLGGGGEPNEAARLVTERTMRFVDEIRGSLDFYTAQPDSAPVRKVILTGGGGQLPHLAERLESALRLPVELGQALGDLEIGKVDLDEEQLADAQPHLAVAVGLALGASS